MTSASRFDQSPIRAVLSHQHVQLACPETDPKAPDLPRRRSGALSCTEDKDALTHTDPERFLSLADASYHAGVGAETIRKWVRRDHLPVAARDALGRPLFRWIDVARAERGRRATGKSVPLRRHIRAA